MNGLSFGSKFNKCETAPIVNGGTYIYTLPDGTTEEGVVMGVRRSKGAKGEALVEGHIYTFARGPVPTHIVEGSESFKGWVLVAAPAKSAAEFIKNAKPKPVPGKPAKGEPAVSAA